jgi:diguanylate cyclase (GGDEF)-like protein
MTSDSQTFSPDHTRTRRNDEPEGPASLRAVLSSIGETLYDWDLASDRITWGANAAAMLRVANISVLGTGRGYAYRVVRDSGTPRYDVVTRSADRDTGHGVPFQTIYSLRGDGSEPLVVEDTGRWFAGPNGKPLRVHGAVRVLAIGAEGLLQSSPFSDPLTGALNRGQLTDLLNDEIVQARRHHRSFAMALVGIEDLASHNAEYGFDVSDEVIAGVAGRIRQAMRRGDGLARYAGSKLAVVLMGCAEEQLAVAARRFIDAVGASPLSTSAGAVAVQVRVGGILMPRNGQTAAEAMRHAEEALADAKASPTRSFVMFTPDRRRDQRRENNRRFTDEIVAALNERCVMIVRQPIVDARTRAVAFNEALLRIRRTDGTIMPAGQIVPLVEKLGFVGLLDHRVLELAVAALAADSALSLSMNVSPSTLRQPDWMVAMAAQLASRPDVASRLIVELTETALVEDMEATRAAIAGMKALGLRIAIDDFGAGHTSFRHLRDLAIDMVKIDGAFVQNLSRSADDRFFVRTLLDLAGHLQVQVVAEWVKDEDTAATLRDWGVDFLQGELFGIAEVAAGEEPTAIAV